ncbi:MAG: hypothetical protein BA864_05695 [Desulfuromonadales bacterium C00003093]|nr:MAG: hypothetical protein BA864_05695 [Desulfuromonadales bacterium C00003093]
MGWLGKIFGGGASVDGLRKALAQKRFADARLLAERLQEQSLPTAEIAEVERLAAAAGDGLARLNLDEACGFQRAGEPERADEHLQLALQQVCSAELRREIEEVSMKPLQPTIENVPEGLSNVSCSHCAPQKLTPSTHEESDFPDLDSRLELVLISYPPDLAERYRHKSEQFLEGFLVAHAGRDGEALLCWQGLSGAEQDDLYWFELGSAQARCGQREKARKSLETALQENPDLLPATEALVSVLVALGTADKARELLQRMLDKGQDPAFCHAQLAVLFVQEEAQDQALVHTRQALVEGAVDPAFLVLGASLLEQAGALEEAEAVLNRLSGGGCRGGLNLPLAEFLLRQKRDLGRILDTFNAACREDPENPRWQLRVAQTYLARNWRKEGLNLLKRVVDDPRLTPELHQEAVTQLAGLDA